MRIKTDYRKLPVNQSEILAIPGKLNESYYCEEILPDEARAIVRHSNLRKTTRNTYSHFDEDGNIDLIISTRKPTIRLLYEDGKYLKTLNEVRRATLLKRSEKQDNARFQRRMTVDDNEYHYYSIDIGEFIETGSLKFRFEVRDYDITLQVDGMLDFLKKKTKRKKVSYATVRQFLSQALDRSNIKVDCTCPDFRYRFAYTATRKGFKANNPEDRPSNITNPKLRGSGCKHILKLLNNKKWIQKYVSLINLVLKLNPETIKGTGTRGK